MSQPIRRGAEFSFKTDKSRGMTTMLEEQMKKSMEMQAQGCGSLGVSTPGRFRYSTTTVICMHPTLLGVKETHLLVASNTIRCPSSLVAWWPGAWWDGVASLSCERVCSY